MRGRLFKILLVSLGFLFACNLVATRQLATAFNEGVLDSKTDPAYPRSQRAVDTVMWRMRDEVGEGYFGQAGDAKHAQVVAWLAKLQSNAELFMKEELDSYFDGGSTEDMPQTKPLGASQRKLTKGLTKAAPELVEAPSEPLCADKKNRAALESFVDYVRFRVSLAHAVDVTAKLVEERFATEAEAIKAAERAFGDTSAYLANRKWKRDLDHHVAGLVVKGGAATGMFSAGVVWVALNVIDQCIADNQCDPKHAGFAMASGTSTGATVVTATDVFHTAIADCGGRAAALKKYLDWYLCSSMNDLYCVRNHTAMNLARGQGAYPKDVQDSMLDFTGLATKVESNYGCGEMNNGMELILNTVDFRTGRLYSLSDQDPKTLATRWDVAKAVVSSAALPFIVRPTYHLPVDPFQDAGNFAYLDGGIRSELPLLALVRRGVERLLVVSSSASITGDNGELPNALGMAIRFIDISTGGVTEAEIAHASAQVEASRLAEYELCVSLIQRDREDPKKAHKLCPVDSCDADYLCSGDFAHACTATKHNPQDNEQIVRHTFQITNVWRNEDRIPGLPGYKFLPDEQRRLMLAGAEAAREECVQIAAMLGIEAPRETLFKWCTHPPLPTPAVQCSKEVLAQLSKSPDAPDCPDDRGPQPTADAGSAVRCP